MRRLTQALCECGSLVNVGRHSPNSPAGIALHDVGAVGYAGECPTCKGVVQLTITKTEGIISNPLSLVKPE